MARDWIVEATTFANSAYDAVLLTAGVVLATSFLVVGVLAIIAIIRRVGRAA